MLEDSLLTPTQPGSESDIWDSSGLHPGLRANGLVALNSSPDELERWLMGEECLLCEHKVFRSRRAGKPGIAWEQCWGSGVGKAGGKAAP